MPPRRAAPLRAALAPLTAACFDALAARLRDAPDGDPDALYRDAAAAVMRCAARAFAASRGLCDPPAAQGPLRDLGDPARYADLDPEGLGLLYEHLLDASAPGAAIRRRGGSHYTSRALARETLERTLAPLWARGDLDPRALRVCDPAMGGGAFLVEALRQLSARAGASKAELARRSLFGADANPLAVELARAAVAIEAGIPLDDPALAAHLREGDALLGAAPGDPHEPPEGLRCVDWARDFPMAGEGFDVIVANPPWVSYAGRAAQPLAPELRAAYARRYASFKRYKNLQGLFVERITALGRAGGRVGVVLPSSMAELDGYAPTREVFDRAAVCDDALPDLGEDAFEGVSQPAMVLLGTLRETRLASGSSAPWPLARPDLDAEARGILARMVGPTLPPGTFGERGVQTAGEDARRFTATPDATHTLPLREGKNVTPFCLGAPARWADPAALGARLRGPEAWAKVDVVLRQTARFPIAARADGGAFRNTLLAGFASEGISAGALLAWLNSAAVRWRHYHLHRDARLGMPQVKIAQLRAIPAPPARALAALHALGEALGARNAGITDDEQRDLDARVFDAIGLSDAERARVLRDLARISSPPRPRAAP